MASVFMTGATGYMGARLVPVLLGHGHSVRAVVRPGSMKKAPPGCEIVPGDALDGQTYREYVSAGDTFVHLVGVAHPSPAKARQFEEIDLRSALQAIQVAAQRRTAHFVYVSVAQPSPVMKAYVDVRMRCEAELLRSGLAATILRPFYVLGPGHYWPYALKPFYWMAERVDAYADEARRLGLVTIRQMVQALACAVGNPPAELEVLDVPAIRALSAGP